MKISLAFGAASMTLGYMHSRLGGGWSHAKRLYETRKYNHGGDNPISIVLPAAAMSCPPFSVPLVIPGLIVGIPLLFGEMVGLAVFDKIDELMYQYSPKHRIKYDEFELLEKEREEREMREKEEENKSGLGYGGTGNPQITHY